MRRLLCFLGFHGASTEADLDGGYIWTVCPHCGLELLIPYTKESAKRYGFRWPPAD